jgi:hypothetical protein
MKRYNKLWGIIAEFSSSGSIYRACKKVNSTGYKKWDSYTPFPVHGLDKAMGVKASVLPWFVLIAGCIGGISGLILTIWTSAYDYPLNIAGKPLLSIPAFIPVIFEMVILFSALTAVFGMFALNGLPRYNHPLFSNDDFKRVTDDKFFISIESVDPMFDKNKTTMLLTSLGATNVHILEEE